MIGWIVLAVLAVLIAVILVRTALFRPKEQKEAAYEEISFDREAALGALAALVRCRTVSSEDPAQEDDAEFEKLIALLPALYPRVFAACTLQRLPDRGLLFTWKGREPGKPAVLMAPTFNGILSAAENLIAQGFTPLHDIYFAFSGGEEVNGLGAVHIVEYFTERGVEPELVLDEGGAVVENVFPGVSKPCGLVGIAEKGMMNLEFSVKSSGGHASAPAPHTPIGKLSAACARVENRPFRAHFTKPALEMFDTLGRNSSFVYRMIFANLWAFGWILDLICKKSGGELNALLRTTVAFTQMQGSKAPNVLPPSASMVANLRLNPQDSVRGALGRIRAVVKDPDVELRVLRSFEPSPISRTDCEGWRRVSSAVAGTWRGCLVAPYLMVQCSDSRHYRRLSDKVYRFSAMDLTKEERASIHGNNEHIRLDTACRAVEFFIRVMKQC